MLCIATHIRPHRISYQTVILYRISSGCITVQPLFPCVSALQTPPPHTHTHTHQHKLQCFTFFIRFSWPELYTSPKDPFHTVVNQSCALNRTEHRQDGWILSWSGRSCPKQPRRAHGQCQTPCTHRREAGVRVSMRRRSEATKVRTSEAGGGRSQLTCQWRVL